MSVVIQVDCLSKEYRLGQIGGKRLVDDLQRWWARLRGKEDPLSKVGQVPRAQRQAESAEAITHTAEPISRFRLPASPSSETLWALRDVSFEVKRGEVLGIIGRNGAGKSTLLKILSRVTAPTSGEVRVKGRIASLLEVGTGFHPELTGRENIFLNGAILGMTKAEICSKFDEIVAFAEVEQFIDTPVKRYSSGMYVRLAFAVAAHLEPEILIVDEVLAVGDASFQKKCLGKMRDVAAQGRTVLFVSHNLSAVENLCHNGICIDKGLLIFTGPVRQVMEFYLSSTEPGPLAIVLQKCKFLREVTLSDSHGASKTQFSIGDRLCMRLRVEAKLGAGRLVFGIGINDHRGTRVTTMLSKHRGFHIRPSDQQVLVECQLDGLYLAPGRYGLKVTVGTAHEDVDTMDVPAYFEILPSDYYGSGLLPSQNQGPVLAAHSWHLIS